MWKVSYCMRYNFHKRNFYYSGNFFPELNHFFESQQTTQNTLWKCF